MNNRSWLFNIRIFRFAFPAIMVIIGLLLGWTVNKKSINGKSVAPASRPKTNNITINVMSVGAVGNGTTDDTKAFQKAVDSVASLGGGTVYVPAATYLIDPDVSINMKSNVTLNMVDATRILKAKATASIRYYVIKMVTVSDVKVIGGKIIGDRDIHLGTTGEWGMGIGMYGCLRGIVTGTYICNCWGDGIVVSSRGDNKGKDCVLKNVICDNNRRQALTIAAVDSLIVDGCTLTHTNGTMPQDGIDIEPDAGIAERVYITHCLIAYNAKVGIEMNAKTNTTAVIKDIHVQDNYIHNNSYSAYIQHVSNVVFTNNRMTSNTYQSNAAHVSSAINSVFDPNTYQ